ncbi:DUF4277 domain-containing protein [Microcoleus vaginatus]|uniref:DUF4277 domain-containing protein n=1 Tax=Microcoleus vaginatus TaxID=119532 RepID=UPI0040407296
MILNGLGFLSAIIHIRAIFCKKIKITSNRNLIGKGILPEHLDDYRFGRALDQYYQVGTPKLFTKIAIKATSDRP